MADAVNLYGPGRERKRPLSHRGAPRQTYDPMTRRIKLVADMMFEKMKDLAAVIAPETPVDSSPLRDDETWLVLEELASNFSPAVWGDPAAIGDLIRLRKQFGQGRLETDTLHEYKKLAELDKRLLPDPSMTPQSPEWQDQQRRLRQ